MNRKYILSIDSEKMKKCHDLYYDEVGVMLSDSIMIDHLMTFYIISKSSPEEGKKVMLHEIEEMIEKLKVKK